LAKLGFDTIITDPRAYDRLLDQIPYLCNKPKELKQWTIRVSSGSAFANPPQKQIQPIIQQEIEPQLALAIRSSMQSSWQLPFYGNSGDDFPEFMYDC
jgi:hypothetical protein